MAGSTKKAKRTTREPERARLALDAPALDALTVRVLEHFERHKPEPASFPAMASRVIDLAEHPDVDVNRLAHLIARDPAICASVLAVANSAANRRTDAVEDIRTALSLLGLKRVANIAVGVACRALFDVELRVEQELFGEWWARLFHSAMTEAFTIAFVTMERNRGVSEGIFLAGMLHNIGKSLALRSLAALIIGGDLGGVPRDEAIESILGRTRVPIGVAALTAFNLPEHLIELCRHQDDDPLPATKEWADLHYVRVVSALNEIRMEGTDTEPQLRWLRDSMQAVGLQPADILKIARQLSDFAEQVAVLFSSTDGADETGYLEFLTRYFAAG
jgi:HD-like signal output (HDOD) protein